MTTRLSADDQLAIRDTISHYAWALDTGNVEAFVACFTRDGLLIWDAFEEPLRWQGADAIRHFATFIRDQPASAGRQHHVTNIIVTPCEGGARAISYGAVALRQGDGPHKLHVMGYYEDVFRQEDGAWRMAQRTIRDWSGPILASFAGQTGAREGRPLPPPLKGLLYDQQN